MKSINESKEPYAYEFLQFIWDKERTDSWMTLNSIMQETLFIAIRAQLIFVKDDFKNIYKDFSGGYWFRKNSNGNGYGEDFYTLACEQRNISACQSYEAFCNLKPFLTANSNRLYHTATLFKGDRRYRVTGFDFEQKRIHFVSYQTEDIYEKGKKQLHNFSNEEWLKVRKEFHN